MQSEKVVETKVCKHCNISFEITEKDLEFYEKVSPSFPLSQPFSLGGKGVKDLGNGKFKYLIPTPNLCPDCRQQRRLSFRNERKLYKRKCDFSGKDIFSYFSENTAFPVYENEIWWSDKWDPMDYGINFDFEKSFFEQFSEFRNKIPHSSKSILNGINCDYSNNFSNCKNCYLCFGGGDGEDCYYSSSFKEIKNCIDCLKISVSENCYESIDCLNCNKLFFSQDCSDCYDSYFLKNCIGCRNCIGCKNLVNKSYSIFNKQLTKQEFEKNSKELFIKDSVLSIKKNIDNFFMNLPNKYFHGLNNQDVTGDYINDSKNVYFGMDILESEDIRYCFGIRVQGKNIMDISDFGWYLENCYECCVIGDTSNKLLFSFDCWDNVDNLIYCYSCINNSSNLFGCVGLKNKSYCILNKQYTKEEYEILVPKIIEHMMTTGEWGEFFPSSISPFGYNETVAMEYFPLTKEEIENSPYFTIVPFSPSSEGELRGSRRFNWSYYEAPFPKVEKIITVEMYNNTSMLDNANKVPDDILNWAIECEVTKKPFRIIKQELEFYRKHNLPIPRRHPDQRHLDRMALRNPRKLFDRKCDKCNKEMKTTYSPDRKEIVYCEDCYNKEVY